MFEGASGLGTQWRSGDGGDFVGTEAYVGGVYEHEYDKGLRSHGLFDEGRDREGYWQNGSKDQAKKDKDKADWQ